MNIVLPRRSAETGNAAGFLARYESARDHLGDQESRDAAAGWLKQHGLPRRTAEAWKYTDLRRLWDAARPEPAIADPDAAAGRLRTLLADAGLSDSDWPRLVFVDGVLSEALSRPPVGLDCTGFGGMAHDPLLDHPILALNTMLATDGMTIRVPAGIDGGHLLLVTLGQGESSFHLRHRIVLEPDATLTVLELAAGQGGGQGGYVNDGVTEILVRQNASLRHARVQQDDSSAVSLSHVRVTIEERGAYDSFNLALGSALARHEVRARLTGPYGVVHINGAQLLADSQICDLTSAIVHAAPNCSSRQTVKNVLTGRSRGVFQGRILVDQIAQKTDGYQMNQALLLSEEAEINSKPELEIYADDVKCSHGATAGALDEEQLFYMRSRGVPIAEARAILVRAFLDDALALVTDDASRDVLDRAVARWWTGRTT